MEVKNFLKTPLSIPQDRSGILDRFISWSIDFQFVEIRVGFGDSVVADESLDDVVEHDAVRRCDFHRFQKQFVGSLQILDDRCVGIALTQQVVSGRIVCSLGYQFLQKFDRLIGITNVLQMIQLGAVNLLIVSGEPIDIGKSFFESLDSLFLAAIFPDRDGKLHTGSGKGWIDGQGSAETIDRFSKVQSHHRSVSGDVPIQSL